MDGQSFPPLPIIHAPELEPLLAFVLPRTRETDEHKPHVEKHQILLRRGLHTLTVKHNGQGEENLSANSEDDPQWKPFDKRIATQLTRSTLSLPFTAH